MKLFKALLIFWLSATAAAASAQRAEDSLAITDGPWKVLIDEEGVLCKKLQTRVFDTLQRISVVEVDPSLYYPLLVQDTLIEKTSQMGVKNNGVAAINGGYFKTKTTRAEAADLIKINGKYPRQSHTAGGTGALGIDSLGLLHFAYVPSTDPEWFDRFPSVLVAGPMLIENGRTIVGNSSRDRHPRSCIGVKKDGTVVLMTVDGRKEKAAGMSFQELAYVAHLLGLEQAINLDGGGSSTLWTKSRNLVNVPSDKVLIFRSERPVANGIVMRHR